MPSGSTSGRCQLDPKLAAAHHWYAWYLVLQGRFEEAEAEMKTAQRLAPADLIIACNVGKNLLLRPQLPGGRGEVQGSPGLNPDFRKVHWDLGLAYVQLGKLKEAEREFKPARSLTEENQDLFAAHAYAYAQDGDSGQARAVLAKLETLADHKSVAYGICRRPCRPGRAGRGVLLARPGLPGALRLALLHQGRSPARWSAHRCQVREILETGRVFQEMIRPPARPCSCASGTSLRSGR